MSITKKDYGEINGKKVYAFTLKNNNLEAEIINYGGIITKLIYKGTDVVLGRDSFEEYLNNSGCFGALIGRNSNRIEDAEFTLNGKTYKLCANKGRNNIHGGKVGFDQKVWDAEMIDGTEPQLVLSLVSADMEEGFPGEAKVKVTYSLSDNALKLHYEAESDKDTVMNLTNHSYFNLNGHNSGKIDGHKLWLNCDFYTPNTDECMPYGEIHSVKNTPFDFSTESALGERLTSDFEQIRMFGGFDHNYAVNGSGLRLAGRLTGDKTGIIMETYTDCHGMQIYTSNGLESGRVCKNGAVYEPHDAICLETQCFPNNLKYSHFPSSILRKGEKYDQTTIFKFI